MAFEPATRKALPVHISLTGRTGSGKTLSALLMARGLVGPDGNIFGICTERGRMSLYADREDLKGSNGISFYADELHPPFTPQRYKEKIDEAARLAKPGDCIVIDSGSHEWSGLGGCIDMAADIDPTGKKGALAWTMPKRLHKRYLNSTVQAPCHVIITLRGGNKLIAVTDEQGKVKYAEAPDLVPEAEKSFIYEMTISATIDDQTHIARFTKLPDPLVGKLANKVIDKSSGEVVRAWVNSGIAVDVTLQSERTRLRAAAEEGEFALRKAWELLSRAHKLALKDMLEDELKSIAAAADEAIAQRTASAAEPGYDDDLPVTRRIESERFPDDGPAASAYTDLVTQ